MSDEKGIKRVTVLEYLQNRNLDLEKKICGKEVGLSEELLQIVKQKTNKRTKKKTKGRYYNEQSDFNGKINKRSRDSL